MLAADDLHVPHLRAASLFCSSWDLDQSQLAAGILTKVSHTRCNGVRAWGYYYYIIWTAHLVRLALQAIVPRLWAARCPKDRPLMPSNFRGLHRRSQAGTEGVPKALQHRLLYWHRRCRDWSSFLWLCMAAAIG